MSLQEQIGHDAADEGRGFDPLSSIKTKAKILHANANVHFSLTLMELCTTNREVGSLSGYCY